MFCQYQTTVWQLHYTHAATISGISLPTVNNNAVEIFFSMCSKKQNTNKSINHRNNASENLHSHESKQNSLISVRFLPPYIKKYKHKQQVQLQCHVLTPLLRRLESSGLQQYVIKHAVPNIFKNLQTQKMHIQQHFKTQRTAHPTIYSIFQVDLNIHHITTQAKHYINLVTP